MSNSNIKTVQEVYAAFGRRDVPAILEMLTPDVSWGLVGRPQDFPPAGVRQGKQGAAEFFRILKDSHDVTHFEPKALYAAEDKVFALGHIKWIMQPSGVAGENDFVHIFTLRDGKVSEYRGHQDTGLLAEAFHAASAAKRAANS